MNHSVTRQIGIIALSFFIQATSANAVKGKLFAPGFFDRAAAPTKDLASSSKDHVFQISTVASELTRLQEALAPLGISITLDLMRDVVKVTAIEPWGIQANHLQLSTHLPLSLKAQHLTP